MNGIHDMGGITNFGPVRPEAGEPVFRERWQGRMFAMAMTSGAFLGPPDRFRHARERLNAIDYVSTSYYENWLMLVSALVQELGFATAEEVESGRAIDKPELPFPAPNAEMMESLVRNGDPVTREVGIAPAFNVGDGVRARNLEIEGHTRLPRYVRGKRGTVTAYRGCHVFPDTNAHDRGENPHPLYSVRFEAKELWGENVTRRDCVHIDLWESYLKPREEGDHAS